MANVAVIFHWPLSELCALSIDELLVWNEKARERSGADE